MKFLLYLLLSSFLFSQFEAADIYKKVSPSIVKIKTFDQYDKGLASGSGVIISKDGMIDEVVCINGLYIALPIVNSLVILRCMCYG